MPMIEAPHPSVKLPTRLRVMMMAAATAAIESIGHAKCESSLVPRLTRPSRGPRAVAPPLSLPESIRVGRKNSPGPVKSKLGTASRRPPAQPSSAPYVRASKHALRTFMEHRGRPPGRPARRSGTRPAYTYLYLPVGPPLVQLWAHNKARRHSLPGAALHRRVLSACEKQRQSSGPCERKCECHPNPTLGAKAGSVLLRVQAPRGPSEPPPLLIRACMALSPDRPTPNIWAARPLARACPIRHTGWVGVCSPCN